MSISRALRFGPFIASIALAGALGACSSTPSGSSTTTSQSTTTTLSPTTSTTDIDGPGIDHLPTVPGPTTTPTYPNTSSATAQQAFLKSVFADIQSTWKTDFAESGISYSPAKLVIFKSAIATGCGDESADTGPFYCPADQTVYLDTSFFTAMAVRFGLTGDFAQAYVIAHEMGHHVQALLGISTRVASAQASNPAVKNPLSVALELQADCFAGVWAHTTYSRSLLEPGDIEQALAAAEIVGDDFLANAKGSTVDPDSWTHGSSAQRQQWFTTGFDDGRPDACDTFGS